MSNSTRLREAARQAAATPTFDHTPKAPKPLQPFPDPIEYLVPAGSICTLSGASGVGKTAFCASVLLTAINASQPLFDYPTHRPPEIGMIVCDRPWRDHAAWFARAGCPEPRHLSLRDKPEYKWEGLRSAHTIQTEFDRLLDELDLPPGSFLLVDPLPLFIPGRLVDYKDVAIGMGLVDQVIQRHQLTMLGVCHVGKQKAGKNERYMRPQDRILGSTALIGYSETAFYLLSPEETETASFEFGAVSHQLPPLTLQYKRSPEGLFIPAHELDQIDQIETAFAALPPVGQPTSTSVVLDAMRKAAKCSESTARRYLKQFIQDGRVKVRARGIIERVQPS